MSPSTPMEQVRPGFVYRQSARSRSQAANARILYVDRVPLPSLAERFGTPLYVYSGSMIRERIRIFNLAFRQVPHTVCYSIKANSNLAILRLLSQMKCGFDVVSGGELERVLRVSRAAAKRVVFSGVGKRRDEIEAALKADILLFNVESEAELLQLAECADRRKKTARMALRVNPDVPAETHPYISTGLHQHKFGVPISEATRLYHLASKSKHLRVAGVSVHIGSQITDPSPFTEALKRVADLVSTLRAEGHPIRYVDAGGGLGIAYQGDSAQDFAEQVASYAKSLLEPLRGLGVHLLLEPGRCIVGPAGVLLTRVLYKKSNDGKHFLIVDAGMNDLLRPSLYQAHHEIVPVGSLDGSQAETVDVVGPVCESGDFFARGRRLPAAEPGDLLAILDVGAYGMVLASNYNSRPRPAEILVQGKSAKVIRRRETAAELLRNEIP